MLTLLTGAVREPDAAVPRAIADDADLRNLAKQARGLAQNVGTLRDADVLLEEIVPAPHRPSHLEAVHAELVDLLAHNREFIRRGVLAELPNRLQPFCFELGAYVHRERRPNEAAFQRGFEALNEPIETFAARALERLWDRVRKMGKNIDHLTVEERHELRKRVKALRYGWDFLHSLWSKKEGEKFAKRLRQLQNKFGYLNDAALAGQLIAVCQAQAPSDSNIHAAAGYVVGWHEAKAIEVFREVKELWQRLKDADRPWTADL